MVRSLLSEGFKLRAHRESRDLPIYHLVMERTDKRLGPKMRASGTDCEARRAVRGRGTAAPAPQSPPVDPTTIRPTCGLRLTAGRFAVDAIRMSQLAEGLAPFVGRVVVDRTDLTGYFDMDLEWTPDQPAPARPDNPEPVIDRKSMSIFTALREQLGVKLENARGPVDVVAIDFVEPPTPD